MSTNERVPVAAPVIGDTELAYVTDAVRSGWVSSAGPYVDRFEREFAAYVGAKHAVALANGTVSLHLAAHALGLGPGDEVLVPDLTFAATAHAVMLTGATPVLVDVEEETGGIDPVAAARAVTERTRAIVPVHLYGHPADMTALSALAKKHGLFVVEDAAEAHGARIDGRIVGALGTVGSFSFYGNKLMTTGEGGMLVTDDDALAARVRFLKDHGMTKGRRYFHTEVAFNYRMTNLQAALGVAQLERLPGFLAKKREILGWYQERLGQRSDVRIVTERAGYSNAQWMVSVVLGEGKDRDAVMARLDAAGIESRPYFTPMSALPHLAKNRVVSRDGEGSAPVSRRLAARGMNLPSGCGLSRETVLRVADALASALDAA